MPGASKACIAVILVGLFTLPVFAMRSVLPYISKELGIRGEWMARILYAGFIALAVLSPVAGWACDRLGAWRVAAAASTLLVPVTLLHLAASGFESLLAVRLSYSGLGELMIAAANTIAAHASIEAGLGFGLLRFIEGIGIAAGPLIGGVLADASVRLAVIVSAMLALPVLAGALMTRKIVAGGTGLRLREGVSEGLRVVRDKKMLVLLAAACSQVAGFTILLSYYTAFLVDVLGFGAAVYGAFLFAESVGYSLGSLASEGLYHRLGFRLVSFSTFILALIYSMYIYASSMPVIISLAFILGAAGGCAFNPAYMEAARLAKRGSRGTVVNTVDMAVNLAMALTGLILDPLASTLGLRFTLLVAAAANAASGGLVLLYWAATSIQSSYPSQPA